MINVKQLTTEAGDRVIERGARAAELLDNKILDAFVNQYRYDLVAELSAIAGHGDEQNNRRIAIANSITGVDGFLQYLNIAVGDATQVKDSRK